jgi:hypothetical protein
MDIGVGKKMAAAKGMQIFTMWLYNLDGDFIEQIWGKEGMGKHFREKFNGILNRSKSDHMNPDSIISFLFQLSDNYRNQLFEYIYEKYKDKW